MGYYIQGDAAKADQIKAAFEKLGYDISWPGGCANPDVINIGVERNGAKYVVAETSEYIKDIIKTHPDYKELELTVKPKFKVGDKIQAKDSKKYVYTVLSVDLQNQKYLVEHNYKHQILFTKQDNFELVPPKPHYDISNFKPFDKVLVRDNSMGVWSCTWYSHYIERTKSFYCGGIIFNQCIPFEGNEALLGTTKNPSEEFINW